MTVLATRPPDWRTRAACRDLDPDLFFPDGTDGDAAVQIAEAKQACAGCPVRVACLDWALRYSQEYGIWGGTAEEERRPIPGSPIAPRTPVLCDSGRHVKAGRGKCRECRRERDREREKTRDRDQADVYARRVARARERDGIAA